MTIKEGCSTFTIVATHKVWKSAKFEKKLWNKRCMIHVIMRFRGPLKIVSNKRLQFTNEVMKDLLTHFVIKHKFTTMYEPSTNDLVERTNKIFCSMLIKKLRSKQVFVIKIARSTMSCVFTFTYKTCYSLIILTYGVEAFLPID